MWLQIFYFKPRRENLTAFLLCLDLKSVKVYCSWRLHSLSRRFSPHAVRPTTLSFHLSVNMHVFNAKSYTECHEDKKGIKKAVTELVSVPVS